MQNLIEVKLSDSFNRSYTICADNYFYREKTFQNLEQVKTELSFFLVYSIMTLKFRLENLNTFKDFKMQNYSEMLLIYSSFKDCNNLQNVQKKLSALIKVFNLK